MTYTGHPSFASRHRHAAAAAAAGSASPSSGHDTTSSPSPSHSPGGSLGQAAAALSNLFPLWVLGAALWALAQPAAFAWFHSGYITWALGATMLGMGLSLTFEDFKRVLATPARIFAGFALQYTIMPAMGYLVSRLSGLPLDFSIGLCLVGSCPGGTASNVVTYLARADVTLSVLMTTASTLGAVVATPLLTKLLLGTLVPVDALALLVSTLQVVLLPVLAGAAINQAFPAAVAVLSPFCALAAGLLVALICGSVMAQNAGAVLQAGPKLLAAVFTLHAGGFLFGYNFSRLLGLPERAARTNSIEVGMQNSALGALLASLHFPAHPLAAVPCAISACMHSILGSLLAAWWRTRPITDERLFAGHPQAGDSLKGWSGNNSGGAAQERATATSSSAASGHSNATSLLPGAMAAAAPATAPAAAAAASVASAAGRAGLIRFARGVGQAGWQGAGGAAAW
ncbi:hypothetical protein N2152v2_003281 [Parachlorella kessleri]